MIHASIHAIMLIVLLGTWKRFVNKFDPYVMYRSVYFCIFAFSGQKKDVGMHIVNCEFLP